MLGARLKTFKANAGTGGVVRTVLVLVFIVGIGIFVDEVRFFSLLALAGFLLPWCFRDAMARSHHVMGRSLGIAPYVVLGLVAFRGVLENWLEGIPVVPPALFALIGLYLGVFFWFLSDPRIVRLED